MIMMMMIKTNDTGNGNGKAPVVKGPELGLNDDDHHHYDPNAYADETTGVMQMMVVFLIGVMMRMTVVLLVMVIMTLEVVVMVTARRQL